MNQAYLRNVMVFAQRFKFRVEFVDTILVRLASQLRNTVCHLSL
jgi:hypothetical protein